MTVLPVVISTEAPIGGPALRVIASSGVPIGGSAQPVYVVSDAEIASGAFVEQGNPPIEMALSSGVALGGRPIPIRVISGSFNPTPPPTPDPILDNPAFVQQNTVATNDMGPDGYNWPQAGPHGPIVVDGFGKIIALSETIGGSHAITYSNDSGATWADALALGFLTRGAAAYNTADDRLEVCWAAQAMTDGILYRRYAPTRDGSNNITGWSVVGAGYCQLDAETTGTMDYQHPMILWLDDAAYGAHGAVVCVWCCRNTGVGGTGNEIRAAMRILSNTAADNTASNWTHIGINSTTTIGNAPLSASYTALLANSTTGIPHVAAVRQADLSLFIGYHTGTVTGGAMAGSWAYRRATWNSGSNNWTALTAAATICNIVRSGTDTGYNRKGELLSKPVEDSAGNLYLGIATWKGNASGDTWGYAQITPADVVTLVDSYSAGGAHSYAPTGDLEYDSIADRIISSYIKTTTQFAYVQLYDGTTLAGSETLAFDTAPVDIPLIRTRTSAGKLGMLFRDTDTPHLGWFGTLDWAVATTLTAFVLQGALTAIVLEGTLTALVLEA